MWTVPMELGSEQPGWGTMCCPRFNPDALPDHTASHSLKAVHVIKWLTAPGWPSMKRKEPTTFNLCEGLVFRALLGSQKNWAESTSITTHALPPHRPCLPHHQRATSMWCVCYNRWTHHVSTFLSPNSEFTLGLALGGIHFMGIEQHTMTCVSTI